MKGDDGPARPRYEYIHAIALSTPFSARIFSPILAAASRMTRSVVARVRAAARSFEWRSVSLMPHPSDATLLPQKNWSPNHGLMIVGWSRRKQESDQALQTLEGVRLKGDVAGS